MTKEIREFEERLKNEHVKGFYQWIDVMSWEKRKPLQEHVQKLYTETGHTFTRRQRTIVSMLLKYNLGVLRIQELDLDLPNLDEEEINELITFYHLEHPQKRYDQIKAQIASPESFLTRIPYLVLRELQKRGKVPFDRQIFVACLIRFNVWHGASYTKTLAPEAKKHFTTFFPQDDFTIDILMAVFEMELGVNRAFYVDRAYNIGAIIHALVENGRIPRQQIQQKLFEAFNNPTLKKTTHGWAKNIYQDLAFTLEENITCQDQLIELLNNSQNLLVSFGVSQLKKIVQHPNFNWQQLINSLDGIVYREKQSGTLKTVLAILHKHLKKDPTLLVPTCTNLAPIFLQEDNKIQVAAKKIYELLDLETPNETIKEALQPFQTTMHTEVKKALVSLLEAEEETAVSYETYTQQTYTPPPCTTTKQLRYIENENDFIFLASKVLKSRDAVDYELFLEGILRYHSLKDSHKKALQPALKQAKKMVERIDISARRGVYHIMAAQLICIWLDPSFPTLTAQINHWKKQKKKEDGYHYTATRWLKLFRNFPRIGHIIELINSNSSLPLLSTPSHEGGAIHPDILLERLTIYEQAKQVPFEKDFCIAICRLNRWTAFSKQKLQTLSPTEHTAIVTYLLDEKAAFQPEKMKQLKSIWLTAYVLKKPAKGLQALMANYQQKDWWTHPFEWDWYLDRRYSTNWSWARLNLNFEPTNDTRNWGHLEYHLNPHEFIIADVEHWIYRDLFQLDPLYFNYIQRAFAYLSDIEASESKMIMEIVKQSTIYLRPLDRAGNLLLSLSLVCNIKSIRTATFDWLCLLIDHQYLDIDEFKTGITKIIANEHHPIPLKRICEHFDQLLQIGGVYLNVLQQLLEDLIPKLNVDNLPKSCRSLLHYYYEVRQYVSTPIPPAIITVLEAMKSVNTVKKEAKKLLG